MPGSPGNSTGSAVSWQNSLSLKITCCKWRNFVNSETFFHSLNQARRYMMIYIVLDPKEQEENTAPGDRKTEKMKREGIERC